MQHYQQSFFSRNGRELIQLSMIREKSLIYLLFIWVSICVFSCHIDPCTAKLKWAALLPAEDGSEFSQSSIPVMNFQAELGLCFHCSYPSLPFFLNAHTLLSCSITLIFGVVISVGGHQRVCVCWGQHRAQRPFCRGKSQGECTNPNHTEVGARLEPPTLEA